MPGIDRTRRRVLRGGIVAGSLFAPLPYAWVWAAGAGQEGALKLIKAPKIALVMGNGKYKDAPELKNPPNDAKAIGEVLKASGFEVTMKLDTQREEMLAAIRAYVHAMEQKKCVGLFYYAGHGVQLAWRNYLLPIDAVIDKIDDVAKQSIDIARLMEGLTKAQNPMNVIILDACRENPFGKDFRVEHKGLSQMDAPNDTLLAYATSPGNVASDGSGSNGLYTENLLREIKVPEAKIEDVFKRVRLGVRRATKGAQIPWESTSLEEDFWFLPPKELKKLSDDEKERLFKAETEVWVRAKEAEEPGPVVEYLNRYPSGLYSELAQQRLNVLLAKQGEKKIVIEKQTGNPYTKGTTEFGAFKIGDSYVSNFYDMYTKVLLRTVSVTVEKITDREVVFSGGLITDPLGNTRRFPDGRTYSDLQNVPLEFAVGKTWSTRFTGTALTGAPFTAQYDYRIATRESITLPAGTFNAFRIDGVGYINTNGRQLRGDSKRWFDPDRSRLHLIYESSLLNEMGRTIRAEREEMQSLKQA